MFFQFDPNELRAIQDLIRSRHYDSAVTKSCAMLEGVLKNLVFQAMAELPPQDRDRLLEAEREIGKGNRTVRDFHFGEVVGVMRSGSLLKKWAKHVGRDPGMLHGIAMDYIVTLRNGLSHNHPDQAHCTENDANLVFCCLKSWLTFLGYCEEAGGTLDAGKSVAEHHARYLSGRTDSNYHSDKLSERRRLHIQSGFSLESDRESFRWALGRIGTKERLCGLDLGCADGFVTESRFLPEDGFKLVLGVDVNRTLMDAAKDHGIFRYRWMDVEAPDFETRMRAVLEELGIDGFDLIFSALTLHHLKRPEDALRRLRPFLHAGGAVILRGVDDGALISFGDHGLVEKIIEESIATRHMSDRFHARKFYSLLRDAGFTDIKMQYGETDTVGRDEEERDLLFRYYFKFRSDYTRRQAESDPENPELRRRHDELVVDLNDLEEIFQKPEFYFMVMTISAVAFKD